MNRMTDYNNVDGLDGCEADLLNEYMWEHPDSYGGHSPDGDILLLSTYRDADTIQRSNWITIRAHLEKHGIEVHQDYDETEPANVYDFRAGCSMFGWHEYLIVPACAPIETLKIAAQILDDLAGYSIFNEDHHSELEYIESAEFWEKMSVSDRVDAIKGHASGEVSIFAARRDDIPSNNGSLDQYLAS